VLRGPPNYSKWSAHRKSLGTTGLNLDKGSEITIFGSLLTTLRRSNLCWGSQFINWNWNGRKIVIFALSIKNSFSFNENVLRNLLLPVCQSLHKEHRFFSQIAQMGLFTFTTSVTGGFDPTLLISIWKLVISTGDTCFKCRQIGQSQSWLQSP